MAAPTPPDGTSVNVDTKKPKETTAARPHATYSVARTTFQSSCPADCEMPTNGMLTPCHPNASPPAIKPVSVMRTVAESANRALTPSLAPSSRARLTGRTSRYRRLPQEASAATASPANRATMSTSRNRLMKRSAATGTISPELGASTNNPPSPPCGLGGLALRAMVAMVGMSTAMPRAT